MEENKTVKKARTPFETTVLRISMCIFLTAIPVSAFIFTYHREGFWGAFQISITVAVACIFGLFIVFAIAKYCAKCFDRKMPTIISIVNECLIILLPFLKNQLPNKKTALMITESSILNEKEELIASERTIAKQAAFAEDIQIFKKYVDIEMSNRLGENELLLLKEYIHGLIIGVPPTFSIVIQPRGLKNDDTKNFIGNITRFFNQPQATITSWAIAVFGNLGMDNPEKDLPERLSNKKTAKIIRVLQKKEIIELVRNTLKDD